MKPKAGDVAPEFSATAVDAGGEEFSVSLAGLRGSRVVLVFYPKDRTPGCTTQACALRDGWDAVRDRAKVFGVSVDDAASHRKFIERDRLPYPLIADTGHRLVEAYGVWVEKSMYGRKFMGTERTTFVIGPDGRVEAVLEKVSPKKHLEQLLQVLGPRGGSGE